MTTKTTSQAHTPGPWNMIEAKTLIHIETDASHPEGAGRHICSVPKKDEGNARLIYCAPELLDALKIVEACGYPARVMLYDEEGVEGWEWTHPDGRKWTVIGDWNEMPIHPVVSAAIAKTEGRAE